MEVLINIKNENKQLRLITEKQQLTKIYSIAPEEEISQEDFELYRDKIFRQLYYTINGNIFNPKAYNDLALYFALNNRRNSNIEIIEAKDVPILLLYPQTLNYLLSTESSTNRLSRTYGDKHGLLK